MRSTFAVRDGIRRVNGAPLVLLGMCLMTLLVALPLSLALRGMIAAHLGRSLAADEAASGTNYEWWQEFMAQASGLGSTLTPATTGFGGVLENISSLADNLPMAATIAGVTAAWLVLWSFLSGGIIDRLARGRKVRSDGFFAACGVHFWRFLRLGLFAWSVYYALFAWLHPWLFEELYTRWTRDLSVERTAFAMRLALYALFGLLLVAFNVLFDYARIRIVVEDRRSAAGAISASARFIRAHAGSVAAVYLLNGLLFVALLASYAVVAPGAPTSGAAMWATLAAGQAYIVGRHYLKLLFYASETALFQALLAHASFTAPPPAGWPESPAAESIANAASVRIP